ncbi:hypothetical protein C5167_028370 [Papaver somniferum]|nr:hypothetical protein C5167_028370 [Papaver somniferum]
MEEVVASLEGLQDSTGPTSSKHSLRIQWVKPKNKMHINMDMQQDTIQMILPKIATLKRSK